jgi:imidazolonepropionase-like amidohydrolase
MPLLTTLGALLLLQPTTAIVRIRLIDGRGGPPIENATVLVRGDRITAAGPSAEVKVPAGARIVQGQGRSLLPGLADMHTHLGGGWDGESADYLGYRLTMGALLYNGVTTVLDPGDVTSYVKQLRDEVRAGRLAGPRIYYTGLVLDGAKPVWPDISGAIGTAEQAGHFVRQMKQADATFIKAYGGLSTEMLKTVVDSATGQAMRVVADVWLRNGSLADAQTGIAAFAHAGSRPMPDEAIRFMAERGTMSVTTLAVFESFTRRRFADLGFIDQPLLRDVLNPVYADQMQAHGRKALSARDSAGVKRWMESEANARGNVKRMFDGGVVLAAGTDAPYPGDYYGEGLQRELELLVEAGIPPLAVISIATRNAARLIGAESEWGTVEPGKFADLLLVDGDPSKRISDTRNIVMVIQGGRVVDRAALRYDPRRDPQYHPVVLRPH